MSTQPRDTDSADGAAERARTAPSAAVPEKRYSLLLGIAAILSIVVAVVATWMSNPGVVPSYATSGGLVGHGGTVASSRPSDVDLPKRPVEMLPDFIVGYETVARQAVPGKTASAAEAVYQTLSMNLDMLTKVSSYARVEGFSGPDSARREMDAILAKYPAGRTNVAVGGRVLAAGYSADRGAYVMAWVEGQYVTYVKSFFKDNTPAQKRDFLYRETSRIGAAVGVFQRTGKQGVEGNVETRAETSRTVVPVPKVPGP